MLKLEEGAFLAPTVQVFKREKKNPSKNVLLTFFVVTVKKKKNCRCFREGG